MSLENQIELPNPVIFIDPNYIQARNGYELLQQLLKPLIRRKVYIHVVGLTTFRDASSFVFENVLRDEYSDREDLNINLFKLEKWIEIVPSSIFYLGNLSALQDIDKDPIDRCLDLGTALIFLTDDCDEVQTRIRQKSINRDPMICSLSSNWALNLSMMVPI